MEKEGWDRLDIVGVTCALKRGSLTRAWIQPIPNNQPIRVLERRSLTWGPYATISPFPRPQAYFPSYFIRIRNHQRINNFAPHFQMGAA